MSACWVPGKGRGGDTWISNKEAYAFPYGGQAEKGEGLVSARGGPGDAGGPTGRGRPTGSREHPYGRPFLGTSGKARQRAACRVYDSHNRQVEFGTALAWPSPEMPAPQQLADDLERRFPEDQVVRFSYLPVLKHGWPSIRATLRKRSKCCRLPFLMSWAHAWTSGRSTPSMCAARLIWRRTRVMKRVSSSRKSSTTAESWQRPHRRTRTFATWQGVHLVGRQDKGNGRLPGFPYPMERC